MAEAAKGGVSGFGVGYHTPSHATKSDSHHTAPGSVLQGTPIPSQRRIPIPSPLEGEG